MLACDQWDAMNPIMQSSYFGPIIHLHAIWIRIELITSKGKGKELACPQNSQWFLINIKFIEFLALLQSFGNPVFCLFVWLIYSTLCKMYIRKTFIANLKTFE